MKSEASTCKGLSGSGKLGLSAARRLPAERSLQLPHLWAWHARGSIIDRLRQNYDNRQSHGSLLWRKLGSTAGSRISGVRWSPERRTCAPPTLHCRRCTLSPWQTPAAEGLHAPTVRSASTVTERSCLCRLWWSRACLFPRVT